MFELTFLGSVPQAVATVFAACVAWGVSQSWRKQQISLRRQQAAEEALLAVRGVVAALASIRSPLVFAHEMLDDEGKEDKQFGLLNAYKRRFKRHEGEFADLRKAFLLTEVHFGQTAAKPLRNLFLIAHRVMDSAEMLSDPDTYKGQPDLRMQLRSDVSATDTPKRPDTLGAEIRQVSSQAEAKLLPFLRLPGEPDPDAVPQRRWRWLKWPSPARRGAASAAKAA